MYEELVYRSIVFEYILFFVRDKAHAQGVFVFEPIEPACSNGAFAVQLLFDGMFRGFQRCLAGTL
jgi:hypothetical protein